MHYLPKWVWAIFCMGAGLTIPFGGIAYLVFGKVRRPPEMTTKETWRARLFHIGRDHWVGGVRHSVVARGGRLTRLRFGPTWSERW